MWHFRFVPLMKKLLFTLLACFYLGISSGATVHFHYCMGELVNLGLTKAQKDKCEFCGMPKEEGQKKACCSDETKQANVDTSKKTTTTVYQFSPTVVLLANPIFKNDSDLLSISNETNFSFHHKETQEKECIPIFLRNCNYRI